MTGATKAIARNLGWMLASRGVLAVLSLVYLAIATRTLGVASFGRFALIIGAAQALALIAGFQTWQIIVQYGTEHLRAGNQDALARLLRACGLLDAGSAVVGVLLAVAIVTWWGEPLGIRPVHARATIIFTVVQLATIRSTPLGMLRLRDRFSLAAAADSITPVVRLLGAVLAAWLKPTVSGFLVAWGLAEVLTAAAYWALLARTGDLALLTRRGAGLRRVLAENPGFARFAVNSNVSATLGLSSKQVPLFLVGGIAGMASAGAFRLALQLAQALTKLSQLIARAAFPEIVRAMKEGTAGQIGALIWRSFLFASVIAAIVFVVTLIAGEPMLRLIGGRDFVRAAPALAWLAGAGCIDLVTAGFEPLLMAAHRTGIAVTARLIGIVALIVCGLMWGATWGVVGIAAATLLQSAIVAVLLGVGTILFLRRYTPPAAAAATG